jgi:hypothetical protein
VLCELGCKREWIGFRHFRLLPSESGFSGLCEYATIKLELESVETSTTEFPTLSSALGNPADNAGFPHFHSHDGGWFATQSERKRQPGRVTFLNCLTGPA